MILAWSDLIFIIEKAFDLNSAGIAACLDVRRATISELKRGKIKKSTLSPEEWYTKLFAPGICPVMGDGRYLLDILKIGIADAGFKAVVDDLWDSDYKDDDYKIFVMTLLSRTRSNEPPMGNKNDIPPLDKEDSDAPSCAADNRGNDNKSGLRELIEHRRTGDYRIDDGVLEMIKQFKIIINRYHIIDLIIQSDTLIKKDCSSSVDRFVKAINKNVINTFNRNHNERRFGDKITEFCKDLKDYVGVLGLDIAFNVSDYFGFCEGIENNRERLIRSYREICNDDVK